MLIAEAKSKTYSGIRMPIEKLLVVGLNPCMIGKQKRNHFKIEEFPRRKANGFPAHPYSSVPENGIVFKPSYTTGLVYV